MTDNQQRIYRVTTEIGDEEVIQTIKYPLGQENRREEYLDLILESAKEQRELIENENIERGDINKLETELKLIAGLKE